MISDCEKKMRKCMDYDSGDYVCGCPSNGKTYEKTPVYFEETHDPIFGYKLIFRDEIE